MSISSGWSGSESESVSGMTSSTVQLDQSTRGSFYENENLTLSDSDLNLTLEERNLSTKLEVIVNVPFKSQVGECPPWYEVTPKYYQKRNPVRKQSKEVTNWSKVVIYP